MLQLRREQRARHAELRRARAQRERERVRLVIKALAAAGGVIRGAAASARRWPPASRGAVGRRRARGALGGGLAARGHERLLFRPDREGERRLPVAYLGPEIVLEPLATEALLQGGAQRVAAHEALQPRRRLARRRSVHPCARRREPRRVSLGGRRGRGTAAGPRRLASVGGAAMGARRPAGTDAAARGGRGERQPRHALAVRCSRGRPCMGVGRAARKGTPQL